MIFSRTAHEMSFSDIALEMSKGLIGNEIALGDLKTLVSDAFNF